MLKMTANQAVNRTLRDEAAQRRLCQTFGVRNYAIRVQKPWVNTHAETMKNGLTG